MKCKSTQRWKACSNPKKLFYQKIKNAKRFQWLEFLKWVPLTDFRVHISELYTSWIRAREEDRQNGAVSLVRKKKRLQAEGSFVRKIPTRSPPSDPTLHPHLRCFPPSDHSLSSLYFSCSPSLHLPLPNPITRYPRFFYHSKLFLHLCS